MSEAAEKKGDGHIQIILPRDVYKEFRLNCVEDNTNMRAKIFQLITKYNQDKRGKTVFNIKTQEMTELFEKAAEKGIAETHALGAPTMHEDKKGIYRLYPNGRREYVEK